MTPELDARAKELIARYPAGRERSALLPLLHLVQSEAGEITPEGVAWCAQTLGITKAQVGAVATFYTMYKQGEGWSPDTDWLVSVCTNTMCGVLGGDQIYSALSVEAGDGVAVESAECLAACDYAPVITVNYEYYDNMSAQRAVDLVQDLKTGLKPRPTRGARLCTLKEMATQLAGFEDDRGDEVLADGPAGEPTLAGARLAAEHGVAVPNFDPSTPIPTGGGK